MKTLVKLFAFIFVLSLSTASNAGTDPVKKKTTVTSSSETAIKVLPSKKKGFIKVLYVNPSEKKVTVRIHGDQSFVDKINLKPGDKGFIKAYNLRALEVGTYWIEIEDSNLSLAYEIKKREDGTIFAEYWKQFLPEEESPAVASL